MINLIVWLVFGGLLGWLASSVMRAKQRVALNVAIGVVGAFIGGVMFGGPTLSSDAFNVGALLISLLGAALLLAIASLLSRATLQ